VQVAGSSFYIFKEHIRKVGNIRQDAKRKNMKNNLFFVLLFSAIKTYSQITAIALWTFFVLFVFGIDTAPFFVQVCSRWIAQV
jgi:hypothetical protein